MSCSPAGARAVTIDGYPMHEFQGGGANEWVYTLDNQPEAQKYFDAESRPNSDPRSLRMSRAIPSSPTIKSAASSGGTPAKSTNCAISAASPIRTSLSS